MSQNTAFRASVVLIFSAWLGAVASVRGGAPQQPAAATPAQGPDSSTSAAARHDLVAKHCVVCHNSRLKTAGLVLESLDAERVGENAAIWEKVLRKVQTGAMPPLGSRRPSPEASAHFTRELAAALDRAALASPDPGRPAVHRLNRTEYVNAIQSLLNLEIDGRALLPADDSGFGFDNNADVLTMSPALLERYMAAATKISRLALGDTEIAPTITRYQVSRLLRQEERMSDRLPFGTRGGIAVEHTFPLDGEYVIKIRMTRNDSIIGVDKGDQVEIRLDGERLGLFTLGGVEEMKGITYVRGVSLPLDRPEVLERFKYETTADDGFEVRASVKAGTRTVGVAFLKDSSVPEGALGASGEERRGRGNWPGVDHVQIAGPYNGTTPTDTPSRQRIFVCRPSATVTETACASDILRSLARRAYRRPATETDLKTLLAFYESGRKGATFDKGIQTALERVLVDPEFLFRVERDPAGAAPGTLYRLSDLELASRLSFFLWSTIPDDALLAAAERGALKDRAVLERQVRRMLADPRATAMANNFTSQWLLVRNVRLHTPDVAVFPNFDENLREAFARETELFVESQFREDRSILDLLRADYTFVNSRLAELYGIPNVYGSHFRRVTLADTRRHGLLGQGSVLMVTSYPTRTSPVLRGKWVLENLLGAPPPPPPPDVPALGEQSKSKPTTVRQRLEMHRQNPVCASCHTRMDPLGFPLENFDAIGRWRDEEDDVPIDAKATLPDGTTVDGAVEFREALLAREEDFVTNVVEKLMTYALGRGVDYYDAPAVRKIVRETAAGTYRWSDIVLGIVRSVPFQMRQTPEARHGAD
jgi:mono/diheme cytochrome c family protein